MVSCFLFASAAGAVNAGSPFQISAMGASDDSNYLAQDGAVAFNPDRNEYLLVWQGNDPSLVGPGKLEIFGRRFDGATGAPKAAQFRISTMGPDCASSSDLTCGNFPAKTPAVAYNSTNKEYLVVWSGEDNKNGLVDNEVEIFARRINSATDALAGSQMRISHAGPDGSILYSAVRPDVAYNPDQNAYLLVWREDTNVSPLLFNEFVIFGQSLAADGSNAGTGAFRISSVGIGDAAVDADHPRVVYNHAAGEYFGAWLEGTDGSSGLVGGEIYCCRVGGSSASVLPNSQARISNLGPDGDTTNGVADLSVALDQTHNEYLVVWQGKTNKNGMTPGKWEIFGQRVTAAGAEVGTDDFRITRTGGETDPTAQAQNPWVAYNPLADDFLVVFGADPGTAPLAAQEFEIFGQRLFNDGSSEGNAFRISVMGGSGDTRFGAASPRVAYNRTSNEFLAAWQGNNNATVSAKQEIWGQNLQLVSLPTLNGVTPSRGSLQGGLMIALNGGDFLPGATVLMCGANASNVVVSSSYSIQAVTPACATSGPQNLQVLNADGGSANLSNGFTYDASSTFFVSQTLLGSGSQAGGTPLMISGNGFVFGARVVLCGKDAAGVQLVDAANIRAITPACGQTGPQDVTIVNGNGGSAVVLNGFLYTESAAQADPNGVKMFPNPFRPSPGTAMKFTALPPGQEVELYDFAGRSVRTLHADANGVALWDGKNTAGRQVAGGAYFAEMGGKKTQTVVIER